MGALHSGHSRLLEIARQQCDHVALTIFVNPTQFGPNEDFSKYPRMLEADLERAKAAGVSAVFTPAVDELYPTGFSTKIEESTVSKGLCGDFRPGHFSGVATVVVKLWNIIQAQRSFFGLKDAQQFFLLHKLARDLNIPVTVEGVHTVRESDGLALSSRNAYLSAQEREQATGISRCLKEAKELLENNTALPKDFPNIFIEKLSALGFKPQYFEVRSLPDFSIPEETSIGRPYLLATAAYLGKTRLIDNLILNEKTLTNSGFVFH